MSSNKKLVSIIVPVFNIENYIVRCIESIISQTYTNLEILLIDDGSTDKSGKICDKYALKDKRIKVIHKENGGLSDARNAGLDVANGDYITFIDGDDWYDKEAVVKLASELVNKKVGISYMGMNVINKSFVVMNKDINNVCLNDSKTFIYKMCNGLVGTSVCSKMFTRQAIGDHRFKIGRLNEDFLFLNSVLLDEKILVSTIDYNGYYYYSRDNSITHNSNKKSVLDAIDNCDELFLKVLDREDNNLLEWFARMALHQSYVALIINPDYKLRTKSQFYIKAKKTINRYSAYILSCALPKKEKIVCFLMNVMPFLVSNIIAIICKMKRG